MYRFISRENGYTDNVIFRYETGIGFNMDIAFIVNQI